LDFGEREKELFQSSEMGVDVLREVERYAEVLDRVVDRVRLGLPAAKTNLASSQQTERDLPAGRFSLWGAISPRRRLRLSSSSASTGTRLYSAIFL
ncbi:MAG: hypothetical protein ACE1Z8_01610, partial [Candidatus Acidiferrales bacterium]